jgi:hypothetical protein
MDCDKTFLHTMRSVPSRSAAAFHTHKRRVGLIGFLHNGSGGILSADIAYLGAAKTPLVSHHPRSDMD